MVKIPNMLEENVDYELIPGADDHWHIRIKTGEFIESVISFGAIRVKDDEMLNFDFYLHSSPDPELTDNDLGLQKYVGKILESVIVNNINSMENNKD